MIGSFYVGIIFLVVSSCSSHKHIKRTIHLKKVFDIHCNDTTFHIAHITATHTTKKDDVIHYVLTGINRPTIVINHVFKPTNLTVNQSNICNQTGEGFTFSHYTELSGLIITKVFPYMDPNDKFDLNDAGDDIAQHFIWQYTKGHDPSEAIFNTSPLRNITGSLNFMVQVYGEKKHGKVLPHYPLNANLSQFTLDIVGLPLFNANGNTRYAVEVMFFRASSKKTPSLKYSTYSNIDDEFTPGTFKIWSIKFPSNKQQSYATWKPVAYRKNIDKRSRKTQTFAYNSEQKDGTYQQIDDSGNLQNLPNNITWTVVHGVPQIVYYGMNLTFGAAKDGWYKTTNHTSWIGMVGSGTPPKDDMSDTIIIVIATGLGAPTVIILIGILVLMVRRVRLSRKSKYDIIN